MHPLQKFLPGFFHAAWLTVWLTVWLSALPVLQAQVLHHFDPTPFRRDVFEGRDFVYDNLSFLHRLTYSPMPWLGRRDPLPENQFEGTVGSTRQDEFYARMLLRAHVAMDGPFFAGYRFRRDEDFDGRFDQSLIGLGVESHGVRISIWGDIVGDKAANDLHADISYTHENGNRIRFAWVAPDAFFNQKSSDATYSVTPYTYYVQGRKMFTPKVALEGFAQIHPMAQLEEDIGLISRNRERSGGLSLTFPLREHLTMEMYLEGSRTRRSRVATGAPMPRELDLTRNFNSRGLELRRDTGNDREQWLGLRLFKLKETDHRPNLPDLDALRDREEFTIYLGQRLPLSDRIDFLPTVFLAHHDVTDHFPRKETDSGQRVTGFVGKFAPALDVTFNETTGAHMTFNLTTRLHRAAFGGGNVQVVFPF